MKFLCFLLLIAAAVFRAEGSLSDVVRETKAKVIFPSPMSALRKSNVGILARAGSACDNPEKIVCDNNTLIFCFDGVETKASCSRNGRPGYCNCEKTDCVDQVPSNCPIPPKTDCPESSDGLKLPDNKDCRMFTYCEKKVLYQLRCPSPLVYDPTLRTCTTGVCRTCSCPSSSLYKPVFVRFPTNGTYYLFCFQGKFTINKCKIYNYIAENNKCVFGCQRAGMFRDTDPVRAKQGYYYSCFGSGTKFTREEHKCRLEKQEFDQEKGFCTTPAPGTTTTAPGTTTTAPGTTTTAPGTTTTAPETTTTAPGTTTTAPETTTAAPETTTEA